MAGVDLGAAAAEMTRLLDGVHDDRLGGPTPCVGLTVGGLVDHLMGLSLAFTWAARKAPESQAGGPPGVPSAADPDSDWRATLPKRLDELVDAWRDPTAWQGMATAGGVTMPAEVMGVVALDELVLHGWDLARATGQEFRSDETSTAAVLQFTRTASQPEFAASREGLFGPVFEVPDDAPPLHRALGYAGRDPAWRP